jgi:hypothetical protein
MNLTHIKMRIVVLAIALGGLSAPQLVLAQTQTPYLKTKQEKIIESILLGGPFAEGSFYECVNTNYRLGLTMAQVLEVCAVRAEQDMLDGYGGDVINTVLDDTGIDSFDPAAVQASCSVGDPELSQSGSKGDPKPLWGSKPTTWLYPRDANGMPNADGIPLLHPDAKGRPKMVDGKFVPLYGDYSWGGKGATAYDKDGNRVGTYKGLTHAESEKLKREALAKLAEARKKYAAGEISYSELEAAEKEAEADPNIQPDSPNNSRTADSSMCQTVLTSARETLRECNRNGWKSAECQKLNARMNGCPDPTLIYVDPDSGYQCSAKVDPQLVIDAWVEGCKSVTLPGPDGDPCAPPKPLDGAPLMWNAGNDICFNEVAYVGDPEDAECLGTIKIDDSMNPDIHEIILYALDRFGGPIVVLPIRDPLPPKAGPEPKPGPEGSLP